MGKMRNLFLLRVGINDPGDVLRCQLVVVRDLDAFFCRVDKEYTAVGLALFQDHYAGGDGGTVEEIARQLNHAVHEVIINQVLPDLLLRAAAVHDAREADDRRRAVGSQPAQGGSQPAQGMHDEGHIRLALRRQDAGRGKTRVIDQERVIVTGPLDRIRRIGNNQFKGFVIPMLRIRQGILTGNGELIEADLMEEHVDAAEVVGRDIDLLAEEAVLDTVLAEDLHRLQQQGAGTAGGVIYLVDLRLPHRAQPGQQLGDIGRCEELAAGLSGVADLPALEAYMVMRYS